MLGITSISAARDCRQNVLQKSINPLIFLEHKKKPRYKNLRSEQMSCHFVISASICRSCCTDTTAKLKKKVFMDGASSHHKYLDFINKHEDHITMNNKWNNEK